MRDDRKTVLVRCPDCALTWRAPLKMQTNPGDTVSFAPGAFSVACPACGAELKNACLVSGMAGVDGLGATLFDLMSVVSRLATRDVDELSELREQLRRIKHDQDGLAAQQSLEKLGLHWSRDPMTYLAFLIATIGLILNFSRHPAAPANVEKPPVVEVVVQLQQPEVP